MCVYICSEVIIWAKFGHFRCYYLGQVGVIIWAKLFWTYKKVVSSDFLRTQLSFSFFGAQLCGSYLKIAFLKKWVQKLGFSNFCVLSKFLENSLFLGLLKDYKNRGFSRFLCFLLLNKKKGKKKMITGISEFGFFLSKNGRFVTHNFFPKKQAETPIFIVFLGARFLGQGVKKRQFLDTLSKRKKILTDNWKVVFWYFCVFYFFFFLIFFCCFFCCFFVLFFLFCFFVLFFLEGLRVRWGGPKGHLTWP